MNNSIAVTRPAITAPSSRLLLCGVLAGPVFVTVAAAQALTRPGFDLRRHPLSLLSLGDVGWIQIANFIIAGLLVIAAGVGMRRVLHPGRAGTWGPRLIGVFGIGLVAGGVFLADPAWGFPAGAPQDLPETPSWHALVHDLAPGLALDASIIATFVFARRFLELRSPTRAGVCTAVGVAVLLLSFWPSLDGISIRLAAAVTLALAFVAAMSWHLLATPNSPQRPASVAPH